MARFVHPRGWRQIQREVKENRPIGVVGFNPDMHSRRLRHSHASASHDPQPRTASPAAPSPVRSNLVKKIRPGGAAAFASNTHPHGHSLSCTLSSNPPQTPNRFPSRPFSRTPPPPPVGARGRVPQCVRPAVYRPGRVQPARRHCCVVG